MDYARTVLNGVGHSDPDKLESYVPANIYDMYATNFVRTVRGTVAEKLAENPAFQTEIGGQNVYSFLYQAQRDGSFVLIRTQKNRPPVFRSSTARRARWEAWQERWPL